MAGRLGGDEFVVLAPLTTAEEAAELGERIRSTLRLLGGHSALSPLWTSTVSIGVADVDRAGLPTAEALVAAADRALYQAKAKERDCVVTAARTEMPPTVLPKEPIPRLTLTSACSSASSNTSTPSCVLASNGK